ncbi:MAG TPA: hypothetical protein PLL18_11260 [Flavobacteriales bacterium]|nr:hypothetical protein [Flavobacteriales bacterium]
MADEGASWAGPSYRAIILNARKANNRSMSMAITTPRAMDANQGALMKRWHA